MKRRQTSHNPRAIQHTSLAIIVWSFAQALASRETQRREQRKHECNLRSHARSHGISSCFRRAATANKQSAMRRRWGAEICALPRFSSDNASAIPCLGWKSIFLATSAVSEGTTCSSEFKANDGFTTCENHKTASKVHVLLEILHFSACDSFDICKFEQRACDDMHAPLTFAIFRDSQGMIVNKQRQTAYHNLFLASCFVFLVCLFAVATPLTS